MKKTKKLFDCPSCGNELPCNDMSKIRCPWCKVLIVPKGFHKKNQVEEIYVNGESKKG